MVKAVKPFCSKRNFIYFTLTVILILLSYFFADRKLVFYFHSHDLRSYHWIYRMQQLPEFLVILSPVLFVGGIWLRKRKAILSLFFISGPLSILLANTIKYIVRFIFGRYWPETFKGNNLSFIRDHVYGFNFFHWGVTYSSFPSGHAATVFAFTTVLWILYPKLRWLCVLLCVCSYAGLILLRYHFLGDIIAGAYIGITSGLVILHMVSKKISEHIEVNTESH